MWSGGVVWVIATLATLAAIWQSRQAGPVIDSLDLDEADLAPEFDHSEYTYIWYEDQSKPPLRVPNDLAKKALEVMNNETTEQITEKVNPWKYTVNLGNIRLAQEIARMEPDPELAMMMWLANTINLREQ